MIERDLPIARPRRTEKMESTVPRFLITLVAFGLIDLGAKVAMPQFTNVAATMPAPGALPKPPDPRATTATQEIDFGPYIADMQWRIKKHWHPPRPDKSRQTVVTFKIYSDGEVANLKVAKSSGRAVADRAALDAVDAADPLRSLPTGAINPSEVEFTFDYNLPGITSDADHRTLQFGPDSFGTGDAYDSFGTDSPLCGPVLYGATNGSILPGKSSTFHTKSGTAHR
jgi:TonB family protein